MSAQTNLVCSFLVVQSEFGQTMQCVVCYAPGDYRIEERPIPTPAKGEILVKVTAVGICAGDAKCHAGAPLFWGDENRDAYWSVSIIR